MPVVENRQTSALDTVRVLAGDIGGTKTRLAVFDVTGTRLVTVAERTFQSREHASLDEIVRQFQAQFPLAVAAAAFGIAGPVRHNVADTTNLPWHIDATGLGQQSGIAQVFLLNDLEANAWGIRALTADDFAPLQAGAGDAGGNCAILAAGTGLGEAGLYHDDTGLQPFATEGGHTDFSPGSELEIELLRFLQQRFRHVSWERVLSGPGLVNLHDFLRHHHQSEVPAWLSDEMLHDDPAAAISMAAQSGRDAICAEALQLFVHLYGVEAGNLALKIMATGGLYLGGGIAPKILGPLQDGTFLRAFLAKGRMQSVLEHVPVQVILNDRTALYGPAVLAAHRSRQDS
jgi:glucokinase